PAPHRRSLQRRGHRRRLGGGRRQDRARRRGGLPAGPRPARTRGHIGCNADRGRRGGSAMIGGLVTLSLLLLFVGGWIWVWRPSHKAEFDAAAQLPFEDDFLEPRQ